MSKWSLLLMLFFGLATESTADYFKWEILFADKGYSTETLTVPVTSKGKIKFVNQSKVEFQNFSTNHKKIETCQPIKK